MRIEPDISGVAIVLLGHFNPAILTPAWFAMHGLLSDSTAESATLGVAHPDVTEFSTEWLRLRARSDQMELYTVQAPHIRLRDFAVRTFREHLFHTPLKAFGINRFVHFKVRTPAERIHIGALLAPKSPWGKWGQALENAGSRGGMTSLTMTLFGPDDQPAGGQVNVTVEPSNLVGKDGTGVFAVVNDHYGTNTDDPGSAAHVVESLEANFESSTSHSEEIIDHVMSLSSA